MVLRPVPVPAIRRDGQTCFHAFGFAGQKSPSYAGAMVEAYEHRRSLFPDGG
jgi:hypothetical protein